MHLKLSLSGLAVVAVLAAAAGCAAKPTHGPTVTRTYAPDDLVLRVTVQPGMVSPAFRFARLPAVSVYGDGRVITPAPQPAVYPGPALASLQKQQIAPDDVRRLVDLATAAGVGSGQDLGDPVVADAPTTQFALLANTGVVRTTVVALGMADDDKLKAAQRAGRAALRDLLAKLNDLGGALGKPVPPAAFVPSGVIAVAQDWTDPHDPSVSTPAPVPWPGPALPGAYVGMGLTCVTASGGAGTAVMDAAAHANALTPWMFGDTRWTLTLRPLLPDETGCLDLSH
jgi:hypothetical protein